MGAFNYLGSTMERANMTTQPSMAQVRQQLTEYVVLPLGSKEVHTKAPLLKSVLLYLIWRSSDWQDVAHARRRRCYRGHIF